MSERDVLNVWASNRQIDPVINDYQRDDIPLNLWLTGLLRNVPVDLQTFNQIFWIITSVLKNNTLDPENNLNDVGNKQTVRDNLDLLQKSLNLSDVPNKSAARTNLDTFQRSANFSDVVNAATCRDNLGLNIDDLFNSFFDKIYPVGTIYTVTGSSTNPSTLLGRGTWVAYAQGRTVLGVGTGTDINGVNLSVTDGTTGGEYKHTQTSNELVSHTHNVYGTTAGSASTSALVGNAFSGDNGVSTAYTNDGTGTNQLVQNTGSGDAFNVTQPWVGAYLWRRTA